MFKQNQRSITRPLNKTKTNIMNEEQDFIIRPYSKKELALMYFPDSMPRVAVKRLGRWIKLCPELWADLKASGYKLTSHGFTSKQVKLIERYLGSP
jgi:hypothetical protein